MKRYRAPWGRLLIGLSAFVSLLCAGIAVVAMQHAPSYLAWLGVLPIFVLAACALFTVRGYRITPDAILVERLLWTTVLSRDGLEAAEPVPNAMRWSIRTFGNGGVFSFTGLYWSKPLGNFRAFVTDPSRTVVLRFRSARTVVLSPASPADFVRDLGLAPRAA